MRDLNALSLPELFGALTNTSALDALWRSARLEDLAGGGDVTTASLGESGGMLRATMRARRSGTVAGLAALPRLAMAFGRATIDPVVADGADVEPGDDLVIIRGSVADVLAMERTALNIVGRLSGIATLTRQFVDHVAGTRAQICETRKTTPGLRALEKYAVRCGGGTLHRLGLYDAALYKDNHLARLDGSLEESLGAAISRVRQSGPLRFVEVEVDTLDQFEVVLRCDVDIILLDNMDARQMRKAVERRDVERPVALLEASGGIALDTVREVAESGVDRISVGSLTHSAPALDVGLDID